MGKINLHAPFAGVKDGLALCTLLSDKKKLREVLGVIEHLESERTKLNAAIEVYGKAGQIDGLLSAAKEKLTEATRRLDAAGAKAQGIELAAQKTADQQHGVLKERELALGEREKKLADGEARLKAASESAEAEMAKREKHAADLQTAAARAIAEGSKLKQRYTSALEKLKADVEAA